MKVEYKSVADLGDIVTGKTPSTGKAEYWDGDIPFITPTDIVGYDMRYIFDTERKVSNAAAVTQKKTILPPNSICVSCIASIGKMCITFAKRSITNQQINTIIVKNGYDYRYVFYLLRYFLPYIQLIAGGTGAGTPIISKNKFARLKYPVCVDFRLQKQIADILSTYDSLIELNNKRIRVLEQMAENLYKEWFVRFRFPGYETTEFENGIPKGWYKKTIASFVSFLNGFAFPSEDYDDKGHGRYIVITIKNVQNDKFDLTNTETIEEIPSRMPEYCILQKGDVIMSLTGNVGRVCMVSEENCLLNQRVCKLVSMWKYFTYEFFKQDAIFQTLCNLAYGTAQLNLSPILAGKIKVILPPYPLQGQYNDIVAPLFEEKQLLLEKNKNLIKQRDLLLPRLMSGKLEVVG